MVLDDDWVGQFVSDDPLVQTLISAVVTVGVVVLAHYVYRHKAERAELEREVHP